MAQQQVILTLEEESIKQGDPLSAYHFILVTELLTSAIDKDKDIKRITINEEKIKL